jgi:DNA-binding MarR family transcriptional regulator/GNAT superfamily N-acetyltransferase
MPVEQFEDRIGAIRRFNRFYTRQIGVLRGGILHSPHSLTEARILFELSQRDNLTATALCRELGLDPGYLSHILTRLEQQGLIDKVRSENDGRRRLICLTPDGRRTFGVLDQRSRDEVAEMLGDLSEDAQQRLIRSMQVIESILGKGKGFKFSEPFIIRAPEAGDMGWVVHRHGVLYAQEYGWDEHFEAMIAQIVSDFVTNYKQGKERSWIAEMAGEIVGSVFVVQKSETIAKLRLLLVEPKARGMGLGTRLVQECIRFARRCGYRKLMLWTNSVLMEARQIYEKAGFTLILEEKHRSFGHDLIGETWELSL